jgi:outer membrane receptor protein involved in Fe transport
MAMRARLILAFVVLTAGVLAAQTFRGGILGTVTDSSGAAVADAKVTVTSVETGLSRSLQTDGEGNFHFSELPVGNYTVTATKSGFSTQTLKGVLVAVSADTRADIKLTPGQVQQVVEVNAENPLVDTSSATVGGTIEAQQLESIPVSGRDFTHVMSLVAGATADPAGVSESPGSFGYLSVNGNRGRSNNYLLDGTDMNDGFRNDPAVNEGGVFGVPATILPIDALESIPVISGAEAEYGRNSGGIVNIITKSGTNELHGSVFEYFRNNALDARNYFNARPGAQNSFHNNQFGGSIGGPIWKDHTFFFGAYEGQRERGGLPTSARVPTATDIQNAIDDVGFENPIAANLLAAHVWPAATVMDADGVGTFIGSTNFSNRLDSVIAKVDHHFRDSDVFTARYFFGDSFQSFPLALVGGGGLPGYNTTVPTRVQLVSLSLTHVISPKLLLEIRGGYNRFNEISFEPEDSAFDPTSVGLNTLNGSGDLGLPLISISGFGQIGANTSVPRGRVDTNWQYDTNLSYDRGRHNLKFGYEFRRTFVAGFFDSGYRSKISFASFDDFIAGIPSSGRQAQGFSRRHTHQNNHSFYAQDTFKATRRLTLNFGLRWDYFGVIGEKDGLFSNFNFDPANPMPVLTNQLYPKDYNNFAPRVSFAYDLFGSGKTVVRGGWGVYYDAFSQDFFVGQLPFNTFNAGPAYNGVGPAPVTFDFSPAAEAFTLVACGGNSIPVPNSGGLCTPPVFAQGDFSAADIFTVDQKLRTPYVQNYNFNVEHQLGTNVGFQIGYVGSSGRKLFRFVDLNQLCPPSPTSINCPAVTPPFPFEFINTFQSSASSTYNALQVQLKIRNMHGFNSSVNYTWSHSIDNASDGQDYVPNGSQPDNSYNPAAERANSNFDTRQRFTWTYSYEFPNPQTMKWLLGGWALDGVVSLTTGQPVNVNYLFEGDFNGSGEFFGRPDVVGNPFLGRHLPNTFLNANAFAVPCTWDASIGETGDCVPGTKHFGNLPRNAFAGPNYRDWDFSISKSQKLGERLTMQLRADFFNILNHPNFSNPLLPSFGVDFLNGGLPDANGRGTCLNPINTVCPIPISATPDVGSGNPFLGGGGPRNIQLAVKFTF